MANYIAAKESIVKNQTRDDLCVLNYNDEVLRAFGKTLEQKVVLFSSTETLDAGLYLQENEILWARNGKDRAYYFGGKLNILGAHNYENVGSGCTLRWHGRADGDYPGGTGEAFRAVDTVSSFLQKRMTLPLQRFQGTNPDAAIKGILCHEPQDSPDRWWL